MNFLIGDINNILNFIGNRRFKFFYQSGFNTIIIMKLNYSNQVCVPNGFSGTRLINWKTRPLPWTSPRIIWESPRYPACPIFAIFYTGISKIPSEILTSYSFASKIYIHFFMTACAWFCVTRFVSGLGGLEWWLVTQCSRGYGPRREIFECAQGVLFSHLTHFNFEIQKIPLLM